MNWDVRLHDAFEAEFLAFERGVQTELLAVAKLLAEYGPQLSRPYVDTLKGSKHTNMKEMRFSAADGEWRVAFAFDPNERLSFSSRATSPGLARSASTSSLLQRRIAGFPTIWKA